MNDSVYRAIGERRSGYVIAPAGCGKTEAIVRSITNYSQGKQLIITHTNAGLAALKKRLKNNNVSSASYHVETISSWALGWVTKYKIVSNYTGATPIPNDSDWDNVYQAATNLMCRQFVKWVVKNSYSGVIVDEYQDCSVPMHNLILALKNILPCRILGDPLQGIFDFNSPLVDWQIVERDFGENLGELLTPYRWINSGADILGQWLIQSRQVFQNNNIPDFSNSPITIETVDVARRAGRLQQILRSLTGTVCVIGAKHNRWQSGLATSLINTGLRFVEPNELPEVKRLLDVFSSNSTIGQKAEFSFKFITSSFASLGSISSFVENILKGQISQRPTKKDRRVLFEKHPTGFSVPLFLDTLKFVQENGIKCKKRESVSCLKATIETALETEDSFVDVFANEIAKRKNIGIVRPSRAIGSTLLLKGLEFEYSIVLYDSSFTHKDLYVALTRASKKVYLFM